MVASSKTIEDKMTEPEVDEKRRGHEVGGGRVLKWLEEKAGGAIRSRTWSWYVGGK